MHADYNKSISRWLYLGVAMIIVQVLLGGITRLTGSGLSITEWKPIMGALPPLNEHEWLIAFDKYKQIGQYKFLNSHFSLADFKFIFFWEWLHRNWARVIGIVFFVPFLYFIISKQIKPAHINKFVVIFIIGGLQGLVGWIMVASGLNDNVLFVNSYKLATHFMTALLALVVVYWYALFFGKQETLSTQTQQSILSLRKWNIALLTLLCVQLCYGAFMAGGKAAAAAPTWPSINGAVIPAGIGGVSWLSNPIAIHFFHRGIAYLFFTLVIIFTIISRKIVDNTHWTTATRYPIFFTLLQILLGIITVLTANAPSTNNSMGKFEWAAQIHQLVALLLLLSLVHTLFMLSVKKKFAKS